MSLGSVSTAAWLAAAALLCAWRPSTALHGGPAPAQRAWRVCAGVLLLLSLAHALALDQGVLLWGRAAARQAGLYEVRRPLQAAFLLLAGAATLWAMTRLPWWRAAEPWRGGLRAAVLATLLLLALFIMRTVSLHAVDMVLEFQCFSVGLGRWLEWAAAAVVMTSALFSRRQRPSAAAGLRAWRPPHV